MTKISVLPPTLFLLSFLFVSQLQTFALPPFKPAKDFVIKRGTNISHWLSQSDARGMKDKIILLKKM